MLPDAAALSLAISAVVQTQLLSIILHLLVLAVALAIIKSAAESILGYLQFLFDKHISINSPVIVYGKKGRIKFVSLFNVTVKTDCGWVRIPTKSWKSSKYILLKDGLYLENKVDGIK